MEEKKYVDEFVKHMMNLIRELSQESTEVKLDEAPLTEEKVPIGEEMLEEQACEESYQEYPDEVSHAKDPDETLMSFEEDEVVKHCEEIISSIDTCKFMEKPSYIVGRHIDEFIHVRRSRWEMGCFTFDGDSIYDIRGGFQMKRTELCSSENRSSYLDDLGISHANDDRNVDGSHLSQYDLSQYTHDFQSYLGSCDAYPFENSYFLYDFQPPLFSHFDGDKTMVSLEQPQIHTTEHQYFYLRDFERDFQMKRQHILSVEEDSSFRPEIVPYLISPYLGDMIRRDEHGCRLC
jgi:hypothetical protein